MLTLSTAVRTGRRDGCSCVARLGLCPGFVIAFHFFRCFVALALPAMGLGYRARAPLTSNNLFSVHFGAAQSLTMTVRYCGWLSKHICSLHYFVSLLFVKEFSCSFVPLRTTASSLTHIMSTLNSVPLLMVVNQSPKVTKKHND